MKINLLATLLMFFCSVSAQEFKGQWKGEFVDKSALANFGGDRCDYVLELETNGNKVEGSSYTYYSANGGKRYYTICKLEGFINRKSKYIEVKEIERTKTNVPDNIKNCFQTHKLTYFKKGNLEILEGDWIPAPKQDGDCGYGLTSLTRRVLQTSSPYAGRTTSRTSAPIKKSDPLLITKNTIKKNNSGSTVTRVPKKDIPNTSIAKNSENNDAVSNSTATRISAVADPIQKVTIPPAELMKRNQVVLKTIKVSSETVRVDLYDNGEIDGDSVSLFYNKILLASKQRLTDKALSFYLTVDDDTNINELVMYAENLGSIPPNTALMVVTDGVRRYEVRITSDLQKSGVINFVHDKAGDHKN